MIIGSHPTSDSIFFDEQSGDYSAKYKQLTLRSAFQPIFDRKKHIIGFEALVRIQNEFNHSINPESFFQSDLIDEEDRDCVERLSLLLHIHNYSISPYKNLKLFLNVLPHSSHLLEKTYIDNSPLSEWLESLNINRESIVLEIMEIEYDNHQLLYSSTHHLANNGFSIAVDDFGTKASNGERVSILSPDIIKLDRSLLTAYMNGDQEPLIRSMKLARDNKALTVIEGIENNEQYLAMAELDIDMHQGFYLSVPDYIHNVKAH